ncbi:unnamed protein product [Notodromas monacha]|uniref:Uncharacterized protein n=1 Tax=Notodromas monacha TaxID=399045 RepID=A0A7R9G9Y8_9CRUS|nr:unnamed protein product [Notodromas monacha]CAG0913563.1 unnamed protein product [Notodromas monacha]
MLHVHVRSEDDVVASEPGDPENWIQLRTSFPRHILEHFKITPVVPNSEVTKGHIEVEDHYDAAPVPPRMMHVTFASGEFDAESGAELVVDALDTLRIGARANAEYDKDDAAVVDDHVRVWATSTGHSPTAHRHAKPARILSSADLLKLRDKFLATTDEPGPPATAQLGPERNWVNGGNDV